MGYKHPFFKIIKPAVLKLNSRPQEVLDALLEGNQRFVSGDNQFPNQDLDRRTEVLQGQSPFAVILTCSDSRVAPEILFDQGIGDLFVIRTAGNVVDDIALGSIEYAVEHLHTPLVMVLGHQKCGAVTATVEGGEAGGHIADIVEAIQPALEGLHSEGDELISEAIDANVVQVAQQLSASEPILAEAVHNGMLAVVGARYDLDTGEVVMLEISSGG